MNPNTRASLASSSSRTFPVNAVVYKEGWIQGKDNVRLLRAPSIESDIVWKARSLRFDYSVLRPKLGEPYYAETLISIFREHFPLGTQQLEHESDVVVEKFCNCFNDALYLPPLGFYKQNAETSECVFSRNEIRFATICTWRPIHYVSAMRLDIFFAFATIAMQNSNEILSTPTKASTTKSSDSDQRSMFSAATNLNSKFMPTPGRVATVVDNGQMSSMINIPDSASISGTSTPPPNAVDNEGDGTSGNEGDNTQPPSDSNHGFDKVTATLAPKTAQLLANRRSHGGKSSRSYYELLDILDAQVAFHGAGIRWNDMFELGVNNAGSSNVVKYDGM